MEIIEGMSREDKIAVATWFREKVWKIRGMATLKNYQEIHQRTEEYLTLADLLEEE